MLNALANTSFSPAARSFIGTQAAPILGIATKRAVVDPAVSRRFRMSSVATASTTCDEEDEDVAQEPNPFDLSEKKKWDRARFGKLDHTSFGRLSDCVQMTWPKEHQMHFVTSKNQSLTYRWVDVEKEADDVAGIYQRAIDEMKGNSDYIWHHNPAEIRRLVASGMHSIWGAYLDDGTLVSVNSAEFMLGQRGVHWIWGAVDPPVQGQGRLGERRRLHGQDDREDRRAVRPRLDGHDAQPEPEDDREGAGLEARGVLRGRRAPRRIGREVLPTKRHLVQ